MSTRQIHIDTITPAEHLSPTAAADEDFNSSVKTEIARCQLIDHQAGRLVACAKCRVQGKLESLYRCYYCAVWYCRKCAGIHFGAPSQSHDERGVLFPGDQLRAGDADRGQITCEPFGMVMLNPSADLLALRALYIRELNRVNPPDPMDGAVTQEVANDFKSE